ncbi:MAG: hypothetical protein AAF219_06030 [Myxococcota bacterium]
MTEVNRSWGQWVRELAGRARDAAEDAVGVAMEATGTDVAIDCWSSNSPQQVTHAFRNATDEWVTDRFGDAAGDAARLAAVPLGAAARFSVAGVQAFDHPAQRATDIANGRDGLLIARGREENPKYESPPAHELPGPPIRERVSVSFDFEDSENLERTVKQIEPAASWS